jgi:L-fuculose-phosphate aldolase
MANDVPINITPIGVIHCRLQTAGDTPKNYSESEQVGTLEVFPEYQEAMAGLKPGQTLVALFWLHKAKRDLLKVYPRGDKSRGLHGVFSTRSPIRPNPIAISELKILGIKDNMIEVFGVDVFDGTPLLDIKKKI